MDLLEATVKVVENRNTVQANITFYKTDLKKYEEYIGHLKEQLQETQLLVSQNKEILEINNFTKNTFNENCKVVKELFGKLYSNIQEVQEKLTTILDQETSLENLHKENEGRCNALHTKFKNNLKLIEMRGNHSRENLAKESSNMQSKLNKIKSELNEMDESWKNAVEENEEKLKSLKALKLDFEILQDHLEKQQEEEELSLKSFQEKEESNKLILEENIKELEALENQLIKTEEEIFKIKQNTNENLKVKEEMVQTYNLVKSDLAAINKKCGDVEQLIREIKQSSIKTADEIKKETELKKELIKKIDEEIQSQKNNIVKVNEEIEEITLKIDSLNNEIENIRQDYKEKEIVKETILNNTDKITQDYENLTTESENLLNEINNYKTNLKQKEHELQQLTTMFISQITEIQQKTEIQESEIAAEREDVEKEIQELDSLDKNLQQTVSDLEQKIKESNTKRSQIENEIDEKNNKLKMLQTQCDSVSNEIKKLEVSKEQTAKLISNPPLKPSSKRMPPPRVPQKRTILDMDSDSSVDGERLSYAEFMAKKKMMKETRKQKSKNK